ncbi:cysteine synthase family protein [Chryseomicrobium sp. FSL W7-1435]|uniref:PLP-dependent cysteine synthase family protein n=1 Tax=Chryseomicrobium sp. FSL W7-1435 TaxID=2921704 RepID=UPI00315A0A1F
MIYTHVHQLIGNTPLFEISQIAVPNNCRIVAKLEYMNPGGSVKDRLGIALLRDAEQRGKLAPGGTVIEPTAGNTGIGLALAAIGRGFRVICVVPEKFSIEKQKLMKALGAELVNTPTSEGMKGAIAKAHTLAKEIPGSFVPGQFENSANPEAYIDTMGPEIYQALNGKVDAFVAGAGSGGTFMGVSTYLKQQDPTIRTVIVEPEGSILNGGESGPHDTEGIGMEFLPPFMKQEYMEGIHTIMDKEAFYWMRELAKQEGLLVGSSAGAAFAAALREAKTLPEGSVIATVFADSSERYLSKDVYELWKEEDSHA